LKFTVIESTVTHGKEKPITKRGVLKYIAMKYYAISDLMGNLEPGCFSPNPSNTFHLFYCKTFGGHTVRGANAEAFWKVMEERGYSVVEMDIPDPIPALTFPHKKVAYSLS